MCWSQGSNDKQKWMSAFIVIKVYWNLVAYSVQGRFLVFYTKKGWLSEV